MLANQKLAFILEHLEAGRTVYISTHLRTWKLARKHADMVKVAGSSLYLQNGKRWDCIDYCRLEAH
jgi:hypothetical protein